MHPVLENIGEGEVIGGKNTNEGSQQARQRPGAGLKGLVKDLSDLEGNHR